MSEKITPLSSGVEGLFIKNARFNTTLISFNFYLPLHAETTAGFALLPFLLTTCSAKYSNFSGLNYMLSRLYGAQLEASTEKAGDFQLLKISVSVIDDRFTLDGESLTKEACELLLHLIFEPKISDNAFYEVDVQREKRKAIEHIRGEKSEKRIYAKTRMIEEMYAGEPYGVPKCGTEEEVAALTGASLYEAWKKMLSSAFVRVNVVSSVLPSGLFESVSDKFSQISRENVTDCTVIVPTMPAKEVKTVTERLDIAQGKLVMGFSSDLYGEDETTASLMVLCDIFGGGPYSRLFSNVREKMSLCYYCSASSKRSKGLVMVESGVEAQNADRAQDEILNQLAVMQKDEFTDFELQASLKSLNDSLKSYDDSQAALDLWYSLRISCKQMLSPDDMAELLQNVKREDVVAAARGVKLHTVYRLLPKE